MIREFQGEYRWLSNFAPVYIILDGKQYQSVEHAFLSAKSNDPEWKQRCSEPIETIGQLKRASRNVRLVPGWDASVKTAVMMECLEQKFRQEPYRSKLLATGHCHIQEGNTWGDRIWGVDLRTGQGRNMLGVMIMGIRSSLRTTE